MTSATDPAKPGDDFIPAPAGEASSSPSAMPTGSLGDPAATGIQEQSAGLGQTGMILSILVVLALTGLLLILKNVIRKSLIASRATMDSANAAGWSWYLALLGTGALVVAGIAGNLFQSIGYVVLTGAVFVVGVIVSLMMVSRAKRSA